MTAFRAASSASAALAASVAVGLGAGVATSYLQGVLPGGWNTLANSGAVWTVVAFVTAAACSGPRWVGALAGTLTLLAEVTGYYAVAAALRDVPTTLSERVLWTVAALWIGPLAGAAGHAFRRGAPDLRVISVAAVCGVIAGEGVHLVRRVPEGWAPGWTEIVLGGALAALAIGASSAAVRARLVAAALALGCTAAVYVAYGQTLLG